MHDNKQMNQPMMIEYAPNCLVLQNENAKLVTALPYLDEKVDEAYSKKVNDLIL